MVDTGTITAHTATLGVVVIGRNEGERLHACLSSVRGSSVPVVYVDSGSTDGSVEWAIEHGALTVNLDMSMPFTAARARNAGFERLHREEPGIELVQFIDGDCVLEESWLEAAARELQGRPDVAAVCGRLKERFPERSIYNRLMELEWERPTGEVDACGGIFMVRAAAFEAVGGFNPAVAAGEEPDLCARMRAQGWKVIRLDRAMALHDAAMVRFGQWWRRAVRTGYGAMDVAGRHGMAGDAPFMTHIRRARWWGGYIPALVFVAALAAGVLGGWWPGVGVFLLGSTVYPLQAARLAWRIRRQGRPWSTAWAFGALTVIGKWAELIGHRRYLRENVKSMNTPADKLTPWQADKLRYPGRPFLKEQSIWAIAVYRYGQKVERMGRGPLYWFCDRVYWLLFRVVETLTGISLPRRARVGPGLRIHHFGNIFIHENSVIGANCTLRQGVTIGNRHEGGATPVIEDGVELGAYAQVLGGVRIGRGAKIGAMSVVLEDVPAGATAVGVPARIIGSQATLPEAAPTESVVTQEPAPQPIPEPQEESTRSRPSLVEAIKLAYLEQEG